MKRKWVAIIGSAESGREYDPAIKKHDEALLAAQLYGRALAKEGYGLVVYSLKDTWIDRRAADGYREHPNVAEKTIRVIYPANEEGHLAHPDINDAVFDRMPDRDSEWEVSFYRSIATLDGIVLIGGARSALIAGVLARTLQIPLVALGTVGGAGTKIWKSMSPGTDLVTEEQISMMGTWDLTPQRVERLVKALGEQANVRRKRERVKRGPQLLAAAALLGWILLLPLGYWLLNLKDEAGRYEFGSLFVACLFVAPLIAGVSGATVRLALNAGRQWEFATTFLGAAAGGAAGIAYVITQFVGGSEPTNMVWLATAAVFGFVGGMTYDRVFERLSETSMPSVPSG